MMSQKLNQTIKDRKPQQVKPKGVYLGVRIIEIKEKIDLVVEKVGIKVEIRKAKRHIYEEPKRMYQIINKQGKRITNL